MRNLQESLLDDDEELFDATKATDEFRVRQHIKEFYHIQNDKEIWIKPSLKIVLTDLIRPKSNIESLELPCGYKWVLKYAELDTIWIVYCDKLKNLRGLPESVNNLVIYHCNGLESLDGLSTNIDKLEISYCNNLKNLKDNDIKYDNKYVGKFYIEHCDRLESLDGLPIHMKIFKCMHCNKLKSFKGFRKGTILEKVICRHCKGLESLDGLKIDLNETKLTIKNCKKISPEIISSYFEIPPEKVAEIIK